MGVRENVQRRIDQKRQEITEWEAKVREGKAYIQGLEDMLRLLPRNDRDVNAGPKFRQGSLLNKTYSLLKKTGRPIHIDELLELLGKAVTRENKAGLSGTLAAYVRRQEVFSRPAPNTFGLIELTQTAENGLQQELPEVD